MMMPRPQLLSLVPLYLRMGLAHPWRFISSMLIVTLAVGILVGFQAISTGFKTVTENTGRTDTLLIVSAGAQSEAASSIAVEDAQIVEDWAASLAAPPSLSRESVKVIPYRLPNGQKSGLPIRGLSVEAAAARPDFALEEGRNFEPGRNEAIVGRSVTSAYPALSIGGHLDIAGTDWLIVGEFSNNGSVYESEVWVDAATFKRLLGPAATGDQTIRLGTDGSPTALADVKTQIGALTDDRLVTADEQTFFGRQSGRTTDFIIFLGWPLATIMSIGALAGILNAMSYSVSSKRREIATLKLIGYSPGSVFWAVMAEACLLGAGGAVIALSLAGLLAGHVTSTAMGSDFARLVFSPEVDAGVITDGLLLGVVLGSLSGLLPARRASRMSARDAAA